MTTRRLLDAVAAAVSGLTVAERARDAARDRLFEAEAAAGGSEVVYRTLVERGSWREARSYARCKAALATSTAGLATWETRAEVAGVLTGTGEGAGRGGTAKDGPE